MILIHSPVLQYITLNYTCYCHRVIFPNSEILNQSENQNSAAFVLCFNFHNIFFISWLQGAEEYHNILAIVVQYSGEIFLLRQHHEAKSMGCRLSDFVTMKIQFLVPRELGITVTAE